MHVHPVLVKRTVAFESFKYLIYKSEHYTKDTQTALNRLQLMV